MQRIGSVSLLVREQALGCREPGRRSSSSLTPLPAENRR
jgi:hypothetical protein